MCKTCDQHAAKRQSKKEMNKFLLIYATQMQINTFPLS